jgi:hypothetical protein
LDAKAKEVRGKLADLDREQIPNVEQAHALLQERQAEREREAGDARQTGAAIQRDEQAQEQKREGQEPA